MGVDPRHFMETDAGHGPDVAVPSCLRGVGMATVSRIAGRSPVRRGTVAMPALTSATVHDALCPRRRPVRPEDRGATCQWVNRRRPERPKTALWESASPESAVSPPGPHKP